ncbi:hypothetical protein [Paraglaciecola sp.]|uniref:hypothetical protein n=1 Tax=Paraglaciecola sp. TaxID=1920173 RepID=UPI003EFA92EB
MNKRVSIYIICGCLVWLATSLNASLQKPSPTLDPITTPHFDAFYIAQRAALPTSRKVSIAEVTVSFDSDWLFKFKGSTTSKYRKRIVKEYSQMLKKQIASKLSRSGWQVVDNDGSAVLSVKAHLKDLYIEGPEKINREHQLVRNIGQSTIVIEVKGVDDNPIFLIEDRRSTGGLSSNFIETDRAMNFSWFNKLVGNWATIFVAYLDMSTPELNKDVNPS